MKSMSKIYHLDQLPFSQFKELHKALWNVDADVSITEKVDGSNFSIGIENGEIYTKTKKGQQVFDPEEYQHLFNKYDEPIFLGFKKIAEHCVKHAEEIRHIFKQSQVEQIFFEIVPEKETNIVRYEFNSKNGVLYLFDKAFRNDPIFMQQLVNLFEPDWEVIRSSINLDNDSIIHLIHFLRLKTHPFISKHTNIMESRKRDEKTLERKAKVKKQYQKVLDMLKDEVLETIEGVPSVIGGGEIEGCIIQVGDIAIKIVDLDNFGERREEKWQSKDRLQQIRKEFKKECIQKVFGNGDVLLNKAKTKSVIQDFYSVAQGGGSDLGTPILRDLNDENRIDYDKYKVELACILDTTITKILKENISDQFMLQYIEFLQDLFNIRLKLNSHHDSLFNLVYVVLGPSQVEELKGMISN